MRSRSSAARLCAAVLSTVALALVGVFVPGSVAAAQPKWAPAATAAIHPGVATDTKGDGCTSDFVFYSGTDVFIGEAAHCAGTGPATATDGCTAATLPLGTPVTVDGASKPGILAYSSWITMRQRHESDPNACAYNDLALIRLDKADVGKVNPSVPFFGGPTGVNTTGTALGDRVESYQNSPLRAGVSELSPKVGVSLGDDGAGWDHTVVTVTPGIPGDSGSAVLDANGRALGVLSTVTILPLAGSNGVGDLSRELAYLDSYGGLGAVHLATGTEAFHNPLG